MKMRIQFMLAVLVTGVLGCNGNVPPDDQKSQTSVESHDHDHDHEKRDGHSNEDGTPVDHSQAGHAHGVGPHGGVIADWGGGKFHVELIFDQTNKSATAFILGTDEKTPVSIDAKTIEVSLKQPAVSITLTAEAQSTDQAGKASKFVGSSDELGTTASPAGAITGVVDGTPYTGEFK